MAVIILSKITGSIVFVQTFTSLMSILLRGKGLSVGSCERVKTGKLCLIGRGATTAVSQLQWSQSLKDM